MTVKEQWEQEEEATLKEEPRKQMILEWIWLWSGSGPAPESAAFCHWCPGLLHHWMSPEHYHDITTAVSCDYGGISWTLPCWLPGRVQREARLDDSESKDSWRLMGDPGSLGSLPSVSLSNTHTHTHTRTNPPLAHLLSFNSVSSRV